MSSRYPGSKMFLWQLAVCEGLRRKLQPERSILSETVIEAVGLESII